MANCTKCENGMVTEVEGAEIFKWRCGCKPPEFWELRRKIKELQRDSIIRKYSEKVGI